MTAPPRPGFRFQQWNLGRTTFCWAVFDPDRVRLGKIWSEDGAWAAQSSYGPWDTQLRLLDTAMEAAIWLRSRRIGPKSGWIWPS